jgi:hypothetical protein
MKEFEEELVELRRENFDLKMRIYLMEEQQELLHGSSAIDDVHKIKNLNVSPQSVSCGHHYIRRLNVNF